jgi:hypothetical protein
VYAHARVRIEMGAVAMTDQARPICRHEPVLTILQTRALMRAAVDVGKHALASTQHEYRLRAGVLRLEATRRPDRQLIEAAQADRS